MKLIIPLLNCLICMGLFSMVSAQSEFELRILNPTGFVAPGELEEIIADIFNPIDSGVSIERVSGGGSGSRGTLYENAVDPMVLHIQMLQLRTRGRSQYRVVSGSYPVRPGESIQIVVRELQIPGNAPYGESIGLTGMNVKLDINSILPLEVYADLDVIRIISADGQGDSSQFEQMDLANPLVGMLKAQLLAEFTYPNQVVAGESFDLLVTVTNLAESAIQINIPTVDERASSRNWQGEHARSYRFIPCRNECLVLGNSELENGDSLTLDLGTFHYENEDFFEGALILKDYTLNVFDRLGRHENVLAIADPITVSVIHTPGNESFYTNDELQPEPLQRRDLNNAGDGLVIYDPNTGFEWLKLTVGQGYDLEQMFTETRAGGQFDGFSLAGSTQVESLIMNHMNSTSETLEAYALYSTIGSVAPLQSLVKLMGNIPTVNNTLGFNGIVNDALPAETGLEAEYTIMEVTVTSADPNAGAFMLGSTQGLRKYTRALNNRFVGYTGFWMVR